MSIENIEHLASRIVEIVDFETNHDDSEKRLVLVDMKHFLSVIGAVSTIITIAKQQGSSVTLDTSLNLMRELIDDYDRSIMEFNHGQPVH